MTSINYVCIEKKRKKSKTYLCSCTGVDLAGKCWLCEAGGWAWPLPGFDDAPTSEWPWDPWGWAWRWGCGCGGWAWGWGWWWWCNSPPTGPTGPTGPPTPNPLTTWTCLPTVSITPSALWTETNRLTCKAVSHCRAKWDARRYELQRPEEALASTSHGKYIYYIIYVGIVDWHCLILIDK